jgi:hypothetical protein
MEIIDIAEPQRNCAFQYYKVYDKGFGSRSEMVCDLTDLTRGEANALWDKHYPDCAKHINSGNSAEMAVWIEGTEGSPFRETSHYISTDAESDGKLIWETTRSYFPYPIQ